MPNITWGPPVLASLRDQCPDAYLDCHLMVSKPSQWVQPMAEAGAKRYTFHLEAEATDDLDFKGICKCIRDHGMEVGVAIKPGTGVELLKDVISLVDMVLVMTVEPGAIVRRSTPPVCLIQLRASRKHACMYVLTFLKISVMADRVWRSKIHGRHHAQDS